MINIKENEHINLRLKNEYDNYTEKYLCEWQKIFQETPPCRMNEFGIIDVNRYDTDRGILFIGRETNGWSDDDYKNGCLFRDWMSDISKNGLCGKGHITSHPNMWYNIGRWIMLLTEPERPFTYIANLTNEAIPEIGKIAFTNVNKVRGKNISGKEYFELANSDIAKELLKKEIEIINPRIIVCCGTARPTFPLPENFEGELYVMPHPAARISKLSMLIDLNKQRRNQEIKCLFSHNK